MFRRRSLTVAVLIACCAVGMAHAAPDRVSDKQKALAEVRSRISDLQKKVEADQKEHDTLASAMQTVERKIAKANQTQRETRRKIQETQRKIQETQSAQTDALAALDARRAGLARQVRAAYVLGRQGETQLLLNVDSAQTVGRMLTYYGYLQRAQLATIESIRARAQELDELADRLQAQQAQLEQLRKTQVQALAELKDQRAQRGEMLAQLKSRLSDESGNLAQLKDDERNIRALIESLKKTLADLPPDVSPSDKPFTSLKGKLPWPVRGALLAHFGEAKAGGRLRWNGHWIAAREGAPVQAVAQGRIVFVGWMHRYGLIVLIEHDGGYFSLYGHCQSADVQLGDSVRAGQTIAAAGTTGGYEHAGVYFEVRKGADAIDPDRWLAH